MDNLAKLVEKAKEEKRDMEVLVERFMPLIRHLAHRPRMTIRMPNRI